MNTGLDSSILTLVTLIPLAGGLLLLVFPRRDRDIRLFALAVSLLDFVFSLHLPVYFHRGQTGFQYELNRQWISNPNIHYHMGIDGISMWLVVLTTFLTPLCVLISWKSVQDRVKEFFILLLVLEHEGHPASREIPPAPRDAGAHRIGAMGSEGLAVDWQQYSR